MPAQRATPSPCTPSHMHLSSRRKALFGGLLGSVLLSVPATATASGLESIPFQAPSPPAIVEEIQRRNKGKKNAGDLPRGAVSLPAQFHIACR